MAVRDKVGGGFCWLPPSNETPVVRHASFNLGLRMYGLKRLNKLLLALKIMNTLKTITVLSIDESLIKQAAIPTAYTSS